MKVTLGDVSTMIKRGISPKYVDNEGFVVLNQKCIRDFKVSFIDSRLTSKEKKSSEEKFLQVGDVLINSTGTGTLGRTGFVKELFEKTTVDTHVTIVRGDEKEVNSRFLGFLLNYYEPLIENLGKGATNQIELSAKDLATLKINLPPLSTQRKIAYILSGYDDLIENNQKRIKILEEMAQQTYEEWFVRMRFPGYESAIFDENGLPKGWGKKTLGDLTDTMQYGYTESANSDNVGPKFLRITDIVESNINWKTVPYCIIDEKKKAKYLLKEGDIVVARTGATVGYAKRINKNCPEAVFASYLIRLKLKPEIDDVFLGVFVESNSFVQLVQNMAGGAAQPNANAPVLKQIEIIVPSKKIQDSFREIVLKQKNAQQLLLNLNQSLREARDILLPRLMMGMIDVENLESKSTGAKIISL